MNYIYGNGHDGDENFLKGVTLNDGEYIQNIYIGLEFSVNDFTIGVLQPVSVAANRALFKLNSAEEYKNFLKEIREHNTNRVIYFPQDDTYKPLEGYDIVVPWMGNEKNNEVLNNAINSYNGISRTGSR